MDTNFDQLTQIVSSLAETVKTLVGGISRRSPYNLYDFFGIWLETYKKPYIQPYTLRTYGTVWRIYIAPRLSDMNLGDVNGVILQNLLNDLPPTRQKETVYFILSDMFGTAYKNGFIPFNFMNTIRPYKHKRNEGYAMTLTQQSEFIQKAQCHSTGNALLFCLYTGCRRGECLSLRYEDIDLNNNTILIRGTKTEKSYRTIPLFKIPFFSLFSQKDRKVKSTKTVFNFSGDYLGKSIKKLSLSFNLSVKDLRTTFATRCMENGIPDKVISAWLGHTTTHTTQKYYEKTLPEFQQKEAQKLESAF